jgi:hypothetical protein
VTAVALTGLTAPAAADAARPLEVGLTDGVFQDANLLTRGTWLQRAADSRADRVLLHASWRSIAPANPDGDFDARDPNDPQYDFDQLDAARADAAARGLEVAVVVTQAPDWAEGGNRPGFGEAAAGTWKPSPEALEDFGHAIASRYGATVTHFQLWAEPNLSVYLTPQAGAGDKLVAAVHYRKMLAAFYEGVKSGSDAEVITGGTAPYGGLLPGDRRTPPVKFWRKVLCLRGGDLEPTACPDKASFDVLAHHPINVGRPRRHARNPLDVSTPDIGKLRKVLRRAERKNRVEPNGAKPIWATEIWWDSNPPDPDGVPEAKHARWLAESFYLLWKQRVRSVVWFLARDQEPNPSFAVTVQSGLYESDGTPKLAQQAFGFPFVADPGPKGSKQRVWGLAPAAGQVTVERKRNGNWASLKQLTAGANRVFTKTFRVGGKPQLRARYGSETSLAWKP